ncbi:MAG TPA: tetratricopeptide repeat protein [Caulobacteraceae bacterium]|jgi:TPR repeat protein
MRQHAILGALAALFLGFTGAAHADQMSDGDAAFHKGDYAKALELLKPLAEQGNAEAQCLVGIMYLTGHCVAKDPALAAKWLLASAKQGQKGAQVNIGIVYATGEGMPKDYVKGYLWFTVAVSRGVEGVDKYRDHVATEMTPDQIERGKHDAKTCLDTNFKDCGGD